MSAQFQKQRRWPAPLSSRVDRWLWMSSLLSVSMILVMQTRYNGRDSSPFGYAIFIVILFYDITLLILSSKERNMTDAGQLGLQADIGEVEEEEKASDEDDEDVITSAHLRQTTNFWVLAVCQSGIAAIALYIAGRLALLRQSPMQSFQDPLMEFVDLICSLGQTGILGYIVVCCIICEFEITTYLASSAVWIEPCTEKRNGS